MRIVSLAGIGVATLALVACNSGGETQPDQAASSGKNTQQAGSDTEQPAGVNDGIPDLTPATLTPDALVMVLLRSTANAAAAVTNRTPSTGVA